MAEDQPRSRLGRGLATLMGDAGGDPPPATRGQRRIPIEHLRPNPRNPRKSFDDDELDDLTRSIRERGVLQPILVRADKGSNEHEIVAGERRWRAAQRAGLHDVPVVVIVASDKEALEIAIIENVQRADLNALEEAVGYERLMSEFDYSQNDLGRVIGKSRSHVANTLRLLKLPETVRTFLAAGDISAGHARALLAVPKPDEVARRIVDEGLTVRDVERIAQRTGSASLETKSASPPTEPVAAGQQASDTRALERSLEDALGLTVKIQQRGAGGELRLRYNTLEQLDSLCARLSN
jgi:ParB family chromosome partitioning protein